MEAKLFPHGKLGGFDTKEDLRSQLDKDFREDGTYFLTKLFDVPSNSLAFFEIEGTIVGCAVVHKAAREMTEEERHEHGGPWKAVMELAPETIWAWTSEQEVRLEEVGISRFFSGTPRTLTAQQVLSIFRFVAERTIRVG